MIRDHQAVLRRLQGIHAAIRDRVVAACETAAVEQLSAIAADTTGDTIFAIDRVSEDVLLDHFRELSREWSCVLIAEGLGTTGMVTLPTGTEPDRAELRIIVDPIDGTRELMYQKRPAWILTGVAPNRGPGTTLADIELALQTEIPLLRQYLCDSLWAVAGQGCTGERLNRLTGQRSALQPCPSRASTVEQGFGAIARFFPGVRGELATVDDLVIERALGPVRPGKAQAFEDQYVSTGGQLYELMMGHDRWIADLRPLAEPIAQRGGQALGLCCHPYDLGTELVAREAGVIITDAYGRRLAAPLAVEPDVAWIGYANPAIRRQLEGPLHAVLQERGLLSAEGQTYVGL